ncbi:MAG: hypothetical protein LKJ72_02185 [[Lactobacillus] timonensis]|jgi:hypothetical protein|uniref:hypothetical protein n=1 Tax=[Lactobacillus] timonensis TaxID=1970790 RepID=UPI000C860B8A|nr:hypothetical protein [[Lactobacillus] timonensis]MCI1925738.1 hypothetical protein [[Lactobacillus] timonensis]MCI1957099.1 hypothetical protein [[Lactobacillus] timonensis]MCI1970216.1 hypothetical protein [[Lactobacillus] timonensis]MCI2006363.1 hypothetical protein [[Lactobacillus] timonensis]
MKNVSKLIAFSLISMIIAVIVDLAMFHQQGTPLLSGEVLWRVLLIVVLWVVVVGLAALRMRFCGYVTILVMIYYAFADYGGFITVHPRASAYGLAIEVLCVIGIFVSIIGVWYGIQQRLDYDRKKVREKLAHETKRK